MSAPAPANDVGSGIYLQSLLAPLAAALARDDVTDIYINRPGELWLETLGGEVQRLQDARLDEASLWRLARQIACLSHQGINREHPLLSATLPGGARVQVIAPPATRGPLAFAFRKHLAAGMRLHDYEAADAFSQTRVGDPATTRARQQVEELLGRRQFREALALAVHSRMNILVSGGTSTGKTTFLNALLPEVPADERLILIEDTPELLLEHENGVGLLAVRGELGEARVSANDLVTASLRMRPDRLILGELRGSEALAFLRAVNSGHPGSMTTIHADSPVSAIEQLVLLVLQGGTRLTREDIRHHIHSTIELFVHLGRTGGRRTIEEVWLPAAEKR